MTEQDSQQPSQEPDYGTVGAAQAQNVKKGHRGAIIIGLVIAALVAAGVAAYLFTKELSTSRSPRPYSACLFPKSAPWPPWKRPT